MREISKEFHAFFLKKREQKMDTKVFLTIFIILWIGPIIAGVIIAKNQQPRPKRRGTVLNISHCVCDPVRMPVVPNRNELCQFTTSVL